MNGWNELKIKVTVQIEGEAPAYIERTLRWCDTEFLEKEATRLGGDAERLVEHAVRQGVIVQVR